MKLAVCLITADRHDLTAATVASFRKFNPDQDGLILLHADDASKTNYNFEIAAAAGFDTIHRNDSGKRHGQIPGLRKMWWNARKRGATHILHLENDQEFVDAIPVRRDAQCVRLYGTKKMRGDGPRSNTGPHIMGTKERIEWEWAGLGWERGVAHWGGQPSITESDMLVKAIYSAKKIKDISMTLQRIDTLRPWVNITYHMDAKGTPDHWLKGERGWIK